MKKCLSPGRTRTTLQARPALYCMALKACLYGKAVQDWAQIAFSLQKLAYAINRDFLALKIENFQLKMFDNFLIFAQNIDCGYTVEPHRQAKIRKIDIPLQTPVFLYKIGVQGGGAYITQT